MKKAIVISLIFCLIFQTFSRSTLLATYAINKQLIVDYFCVNKDKAELQCEGSCFMEKQLQQDNQSEQPLPETSRDQEVHLFVLSGTTGMPAIPTIFVRRQSIYLTALGISDRSPVFHPPQYFLI